MWLIENRVLVVLYRASAIFCDIAMPTAFATPCPSGPVVSRRRRSRKTPDARASASPARGSSLHLLDRHLRIAGEMQPRIKEHRAVAGRENEAVAIEPAGLIGIVLESLAVKHGTDLGAAEGKTEMTGRHL